MTVKIIKATASEKSKYSGLYPLYGWVNVSGERLAIEDLRKEWGEDDPKYEVMAPDGKHFTEYPDADCACSLHSLLCMTLADIKDRVDLQQIAACDK